MNVIDNINWPMLAAQKEHLLTAIARLEAGGPHNSEETEALTGILHLLDAIQDEAAERGAPVVFLTEEPVQSNMDLYYRLLRTLRDNGYSAVGLETSDQQIGYGFVLTGLDRDGKPVPLHEVSQMQDALEADGSLDLDWNAFVGEDAHGYARINLTEGK